MKAAELLELAWEDLPAAFLKVGELFPADSQAELEDRRRSLVIDIASEDISRLNEGLSLIEDRGGRLVVSSAVIREWGKKDPEKLRAFAAANLEGNLQAAAQASAAKGFLERGQFRDCASLVEKLPYSASRIDTIARLAESWAKADAEGVSGWMITLEVEEEYLTAARAVTSAKSRELDPAETLAEAMRQSDPRVRSLFLAALPSKIKSQADAEVAIQIMDQVPSEFRTKLQASVARAISATDINRGTAYALSISDSRDRDTAIRHIENDLIAEDPNSAAEWVVRLPNGVRDRAVGALISKWYDINSLAASEWTNRLQDTGIKDRALLTLVSRLRESDSATARELAGSISNQQLRAAAIRQLPPDHARR